MNKVKVVVVGAGKIGTMISALLLAENDFELTMIDSSQSQLDQLPDRSCLTKVCLEATDEKALAGALRGHFAVLSATPFFMTSCIAKAAVIAGVHYLDLTEDVASTEIVKTLSQESPAAMIPQCGLAPGFISIVANDLARSFERVDTIRMCVGALPQ